MKREMVMAKHKGRWVIELKGDVWYAFKGEEKESRGTERRK